MLAKDPAAIILSGGPSSVYEEGAPSLDPALLEAGVPVFGMCYGFQAMARALGGTVAQTGLREFGVDAGRRSSTPRRRSSTASRPSQSVWMSHGDSVSEAPAGMKVTATTSGAPVAAFEDDERRLYGVQWHPEVLHSTFGQQVLENFLLPRRRARARLDRGQRRRRAGRARSARRWARRASSAACPAASTPRWRRRWCRRPSATS